MSVTVNMMYTEKASQPCVFTGLLIGTMIASAFAEVL